MPSTAPSFSWCVCVCVCVWCVYEYYRTLTASSHHKQYYGKVIHLGFHSAQYKRSLMPPFEIK
ncbi:hypothetical protein EON63_20940 [archaeon]|nr:MAG: hypothetical protein EON63_20940 [archaeon]